MCDPILVTLLKMGLHYSKSSRENATPSSGTSPLGSYKEAPPPLFGGGGAIFRLGKHECGSEIWRFEAKLRQEDNRIWKGKVRCVLPPPPSRLGPYNYWFCGNSNKNWINLFLSLYSKGKQQPSAADERLWKGDDCLVIRETVTHPRSTLQSCLPGVCWKQAICQDQKTRSFGRKY